METNANEFVDRFIADVEEQILFEENLKKIRDAGGVLLAAALEAEGPENAGELAKSFLNNPEEIAAFEQAGRTAGVAAGIGRVADFIATIVAADFSRYPPIAVPAVLNFGGVANIPTVALTAGGITGTGGDTTITVNIESTGDTASDAEAAAGSSPRTSALTVPAAT